MRCITCENLSLQIICNKCQINLLKPDFYKRELSKNFYNYSFYGYEDIKKLINTKYEFYGDKIFNILGKIAFKKFASNFEFNEIIYAIPIDDHTRHNFSQSAILTKYLKSKYIQPVYSTLKAINTVKYAGKDLKFRQKNKRNFQYNGAKNLKVILIDDLVTSALTILEAKNILEKNFCEVLFTLTLSDAKI
jgi:competence protein ComFC